MNDMLEPWPSQRSPPSARPTTCPRRQQYLECEHAQTVFGEGGARAVSYPVWKLCALLPLPRFAGLLPRLVAHIGLLATLWLPRDASALIDFFEDAVELLQVRTPKNARVVAVDRKGGASSTVRKASFFPRRQKSDRVPQEKKTVGATL